MNIDDVLLTEKQKEHLIAKALSDNPHWQPDAWGLYDVICKAQCLKLLEWQKGQCTSHVAKRKRLGMSAHYRRWNCPYCDAELESKLKEA